MGRLQDKRLFLLDMDGTIYLDDRLFDGVTAFLSRIREKGGRYLFLTNNSSKGVEGYIEKLNGMGIATGREDYLTSVDAAIDLLRRRYPGRRCYVQGTRSFYDQLAAAGIPVTCDREDGAEILLSGFDRELTFQKLEDACILLNRGVTWLATNPDWVCPTWYGSVPDCGSVCEMLHRATGREPEFIGKPRPAMVRLALEGTGYPPEAAGPGPAQCGGLSCGAGGRGERQGAGGLDPAAAAVYAGGGGAARRPAVHGHRLRGERRDRQRFRAVRRGDTGRH